MNFALHPGIEYARIARVLEKPPDQITRDEIEDALQAVFESWANPGEVGPIGAFR